MASNTVAPRPRIWTGDEEATPRSDTIDSAGCAARILPADKLLLTVREAAYLLSVSRAHLYRLMQVNDIRPARSRGAVRIPRSELCRYVAGLMPEQAE